VTDRWGTWVNAYVPLCDPSDPFGRVNGGLGVDYDAAGWTATILTRRAARLAGCTLLSGILIASAASVTALRAEVGRRARAEDALRREEERFRLAAQCASDVIFEWDIGGDGGGALRWFGGAGGQLGFENGQFPQTISEWERAVHPDDRGRVMAALMRHAGDGTPYCEEYRIRAADGSTRDWLDRGVVVQPRAGGRRMMIGAVSDVTSRNRARALEAEREGLRKAVESMEQVLGVVGHELRTPLAGVRVMSEFLLTDGAAQMHETRTFLSSIHGEVVRMAGTVNDLLDAARIDSGLARWHWSSFDPLELCRSALESVRPAAAEAGVELSLIEPPLDTSARPNHDDVAAPMCGDAAAVRRVVLNLLDNARRHTASGTIRLTVRRWRDAEARAWVEMDVADTGGGIPPEILERLGQAFVLNAGLVGERHVKGAGLGLAICKGIAQAHGGSLRVRSELGAGTTITATFRADLPAAADSGAAAAPPGTSPAPAEVPAPGAAR
jgi:signal transduction histidine kinase